MWPEDKKKGGGGARRGLGLGPASELDVGASHRRRPPLHVPRSLSLTLLQPFVLASHTPGEGHSRQDHSSSIRLPAASNWGTPLLSISG